MNGDREYWLKEAYRHLEIALIGIGDKQREHIYKAIESLNKYQEDNKYKKGDWPGYR